MRKYDTPADDRDNMNLRQLDAFRAVMMTGSVTNAADYLHLSQPAVSRLIGDLERSVGFSLFIRAKGSPLVPTPEAESLYSEVERTFAGMDALRRAADDIKSFRSGNLRIACLPALAMGFMPAVIEAFRAEHPTVTIQLQTRSSSTVRQWVGETWRLSRRDQTFILEHSRCMCLTRRSPTMLEIGDFTRRPIRRRLHLSWNGRCNPRQNGSTL